MVGLSAQPIRPADNARPVSRPVQRHEPEETDADGSATQRPPRARRDRPRAREEEDMSKGRVAAATEAAWRHRPLEALTDLAEAGALVPAAELARAEAALAEINRPFQLGQNGFGIFVNPVFWLALGTAGAVYGGNQLSMIAAGAPWLALRYFQSLWWARHGFHGMVCRKDDLGLHLAAPRVQSSQSHHSCPQYRSPTYPFFAHLGTRRGIWVLVLRNYALWLRSCAGRHICSTLCIFRIPLPVGL